MNEANDITTIAGTRSLIDLSDATNTNMNFDGYKLKQIFDDIVLVEYIDENENAEVMRDGLALPGAVIKYLWRKGKVILTGQGVELCKAGDIVLFPNDKGVLINNIDVVGVGRVKKGMFLNERRIFGILEDENN